MMRAAEPRPTPALHIVPQLRGYTACTKSNSATSDNHLNAEDKNAGCDATSPIIQASLPREPVETECERSYYLDNRYGLLSLSCS